VCKTCYQHEYKVRLDKKEISIPISDDQDISQGLCYLYLQYQLKEATPDWKQLLIYAAYWNMSFLTFMDEILKINKKNPM
jgi:hypothetical protein